MTRRVEDEYDENGIMTVSTFMLDDNGELKKPIESRLHESLKSFYDAHNDHLELGEGYIEYYVSEDDGQFSISFINCEDYGGYLTLDHVTDKDLADQVCSLLNSERVKKFGDMINSTKSVRALLLEKIDSALNRYDSAKPNHCPDEYIEREKTESLEEIRLIAKTIINELEN